MFLLLKHHLLLLICDLSLLVNFGKGLPILFVLVNGRLCFSYLCIVFWVSISLIPSLLFAMLFHLLNWDLDYFNFPVTLSCIFRLFGVAQTLWCRIHSYKLLTCFMFLLRSCGATVPTIKWLRWRQASWNCPWAVEHSGRWSWCATFPHIHT